MKTIVKHVIWPEDVYLDICTMDSLKQSHSLETSNFIHIIAFTGTEPIF